MKKTNIITLVSFILLIAAVSLFMLFGYSSAKGSAHDSTTQKITSSTQMADTPTEKVTEASTKNQNSYDKAIADMSNALFIGDSRTVGLSEYAQIDGADFFANVGMSVYNIYDKTISVPTVGKVTLIQLLENKKYDKIYIMLGINEIGYSFDKTVSKYGDLVDFIRENQPDAYIFIQANLYVTKSRSDRDKVVNNPAIDKFNKVISLLADGKEIFYLDANELFSDGNGNLSPEKSGDDAHLYAKHYAEWGNWIKEHTAQLLGEG